MACTGSGLTWSCAAGTTAAEINTCLASASDGATLTFAAGAYTWATDNITLSNSKGVTFACATQWACDVTQSSIIFMIVSGNNTKPYRITGFDFQSCANLIFKTQSTGLSAVAYLENLRIDHNRFNDVSSVLIQLGTGGGGGALYHYGSIDNNEVYTPTPAGFFYHRGDQDDAPPASPAGTSRNIFIEDNHFETVTGASAGVGFIDSEANGAIVLRSNTIKNIYLGTHGVPADGGPSNYEMYENDIFFDNGTDSPVSGINDGAWGFHHQGSGEYYAWGNRVTLTPVEGHSTATFVIQHYRDFQANPTTIGSGSTLCDGTAASGDGNRSPTATYRGYPCWRQSGRDFAGNAKPMYGWDNAFTDNGAKFDIALANQGGFFAEHFVDNRDYFNAVSASAQSSASSPFNGTTGMGFGTFARRPTTCTTGTEAADAGKVGVGYWATDVGVWKRNQSTAAGMLYICDSTNHWKVQYVPYLFPHPNQGGGGVPDSPTNFRVA